MHLFHVPLLDNKKTEFASIKEKNQKKMEKKTLHMCKWDVPVAAPLFLISAVDLKLEFVNHLFF